MSATSGSIELSGSTRPDTVGTCHCTVPIPTSPRNRRCMTCGKPVDDMRFQWYLDQVSDDYDSYYVIAYAMVAVALYVLITYLVVWSR